MRTALYSHMSKSTRDQLKNRRKGVLLIAYCTYSTIRSKVCLLFLMAVIRCDRKAIRLVCACPVNEYSAAAETPPKQPSRPFQLCVPDLTLGSLLCPVPVQYFSFFCAQYLYSTFPRAKTICVTNCSIA